MVASIGGLTIALLCFGAQARTLRPTLATVFAFGIVLTVSVGMATGNLSSHDVLVATMLMPAVLLGLSAGSSIRGSVNVAHMRRLILAVSGVAAIVLVIRSRPFG